MQGCGPRTWEAEAEGGSLFLVTMEGVKLTIRTTQDAFFLEYALGRRNCEDQITKDWSCSKGIGGGGFKGESRWGPYRQSSFCVCRVYSNLPYKPTSLVARHGKRGSLILILILISRHIVNISIYPYPYIWGHRVKTGLQQSPRGFGLLKEH